MSVVWATLFVLAFALLLKKLELALLASQVVRRSRNSLSIHRSTELDDDAKERALQLEAVRLFGLLFKLAAGIAAALLVPLLLLWLLEQIGWVSLAGVFGALQRLEFLLAMLVAWAVLIVIQRFRAHA